MSNLKLITDDQDFEGRLKGAGNDLVVVDFFTTWCGPCQKIAGEIISLAMKYPAVLFLKVDADTCFETAMKHDLKGVPLFILYRNMRVLARIQGAQAKLLDAKILSAEAEYRNRSQDSSEKSNSYLLKPSSQARNDVGPVTLVNVENYLEPGQCRVINDLIPTSFDAFLSGNKLISGRGSGKLLIVYTFKEKLILHSFRIKGKPENGPKVLRFFANHPKVLDFHVCSQLAPSQEVTLCPDDLNGERAIEFRAGGFNLVTNLQIYIADVMQTSWRPQGFHPIQFDSLKIYGAPVLIREKPSASARSHSTPPTTSKPVPPAPEIPGNKPRSHTESEDLNPYDYMYSFVRESRSETCPLPVPEHEASCKDGMCGLTRIPSKTGPYAILFGGTPTHRDSGYPDPPSQSQPPPNNASPGSQDVSNLQGMIAENLRNLRIETSMPSDELDSLPPGFFQGTLSRNSVPDKGSDPELFLSPELGEFITEQRQLSNSKAVADLMSKEKKSRTKINANVPTPNGNHLGKPQVEVLSPARATVASTNKQSAKVRGRDGSRDNRSKVVGGGVDKSEIGKNTSNKTPQAQTKNKSPGRKTHY